MLSLPIYRQIQMSSLIFIRPLVQFRQKIIVKLFGPRKKVGHLPNHFLSKSNFSENQNQPPPSQSFQNSDKRNPRYTLKYLFYEKAFSGVFSGRILGVFGEWILIFRSYVKTKTTFSKPTRIILIYLFLALFPRYCPKKVKWDGSYLCHASGENSMGRCRWNDWF